MKKAGSRVSYASTPTRFFPRRYADPPIRFSLPADPFPLPLLQHISSATNIIYVAPRSPVDYLGSRVVPVRATLAVWISHLVNQID
jgi:hypothetical protein